MNKEKKQSPVPALLGYAGSYRGLTFLGLALSSGAYRCGDCCDFYVRKS